MSALSKRCWCLCIFLFFVVISVYVTNKQTTVTQRINDNSDAVISMQVLSLPVYMCEMYWFRISCQTFSFTNQCTPCYNKTDVTCSLCTNEKLKCYRRAAKRDGHNIQLLGKPQLYYVTLYSKILQDKHVNSCVLLVTFQLCHVHILIDKVDSTSLRNADAAA